MSAKLLPGMMSARVFVEHAPHLQERIVAHLEARDAQWSAEVDRLTAVSAMDTEALRLMCDQPDAFRAVFDERNALREALRKITVCDNCAGGGTRSSRVANAYNSDASDDVETECGECNGTGITPGFEEEAKPAGVSK